MNDEELTFYYYNDGLTRDERQQIANLLATDPEVANRYRELSQQLNQLGNPELVAPPPDMVERWHDSLNRATRVESVETRKPALHSWSFFWGVAVTAALAVGIGIGVLMSGNNSAPTTTPGMATTSVPESNAFVRGLRVHLRESEQVLSATPVGATADRATLLANIIEQNRLYEKVAEQNDSHDLARVLRAFDLVLVRLAADDITPQEAEALQTKLLFELNVVLTKLARDPSDETISI